ncbi:glycosyltransferase family 2 protein [Protaetiibacter intestinalis]|uniref:Glycosyltransferase family 2 protein n=2 Tax=Protaetiibacter intestinalis TaxID=2419774 RepID=A0A387B419_9MICO|nr:glycosyltransferase family 2 protein [Protaetiibacter intestinalis]
MTVAGVDRAIITVSYGSTDVLGPFLASVARTSAVEPIIVVADNLAEQTIARLASASGARYIALPNNPGYGGAVNAAVADLPDSVHWVLISNPDVVLGEGALDALIATAGESDDIGAVGPAILRQDGSVYPSARKVPSLRTGVGHALFAEVWPGNPWTQRYRQDDDLARRDAGWLSGACVLVRREAFDAVGGFDEAYFMYFEDVDLGYRLGKHGYRNVYQPAVSVTHIGAHSTSDHSAAMLDAHHRSARRFIASKYAHWYLWPIRATLSIGLRIRSRIARQAIGSTNRER